MKTTCEEPVTETNARQTIVVQRSPVRSGFLAAFLLAVVAVVAADRYIVTDSVRIAMEANDYNVRETARIVEVGQAQQRLATAVDVIRELQKEVEIHRNAGIRLFQENMEMNKLLHEKGIDVRPPSRSFDKDKDA